MRKLVIDRSKWIRGNVLGPAVRSVLRSRARDAKGAMCCLGFYLRDLGVPTKELLEQETPQDIAGLVPQEGAWLLKRAGTVDSAICDDLVSINDSDDLAEPTRESRIAARFARHGVTVCFVDSAK